MFSIFLKFIITYIISHCYILTYAHSYFAYINLYQYNYLYFAVLDKYLPCLYNVGRSKILLNIIVKPNCRTNIF